MDGRTDGGREKGLEEWMDGEMEGWTVVDPNSPAKVLQEDP